MTQRIIDLSQTLKKGMRGVDFENSHVIGRDWWNARMLHLYSHAGTHIDAPVHYEAGEMTVDLIPLEQCVGTAWIADCTHVLPRGVITLEDIGRVAEQIRAGERLLVRTDWGHRLEKPEYRTDFPRISKNLAHWCVEKRLSLIGVEPPAVADVRNRNELTEIHQILLKGQVLILEGLVNLDQLTCEKFELIALPLKVFQGDGSPVRAIAIEDSQVTSDERP